MNLRLSLRTLVRIMPSFPLKGNPLWSERQKPFRIFLTVATRRSWWNVYVPGSWQIWLGSLQIISQRLHKSTWQQLLNWGYGHWRHMLLMGAIMYLSTTVQEGQQQDLLTWWKHLCMRWMWRNLLLQLLKKWKLICLALMLSGIAAGTLGATNIRRFLLTRRNSWKLSTISCLLH